jgi:hypothetical protein
MARKRKPDIYELNRQAYTQGQRYSRTLSEWYPGIAQVKISIEFDSSECFCVLEPQQLDFRASDRAYFQVRCPLRECVSGGFDFSRSVREAIESESGSASGRIICQGWQDRERINQNRCLLTANFNISISR